MPSLTNPPPSITTQRSPSRPRSTPHPPPPTARPARKGGDGLPGAGERERERGEGHGGEGRHERQPQQGAAMDGGALLPAGAGPAEPEPAEQLVALGEARPLGQLEGEGALRRR